jgi:hypothetical protein
MAYRRWLGSGSRPIAAIVTVFAVAGCSAFWFGVESGNPSPTDAGS